MPNVKPEFNYAQCRICGHYITAAAWKSAAFDYPCPRCEKCSISAYASRAELDIKSLKDIQGAE
jgi:Zn finger protein HypA/HybF involved in hydrogenase expression